MTSKGGESLAVKQPLEPSFMYDGSGCYISVSLVMVIRVNCIWKERKTLKK